MSTTSSGAGGVGPAGEVPEADALEQRQDALTGGAEPLVDEEAPAGGLTGRDLDIALASANEADLAEQALEVPYDDDVDR
jgi:hypothetical protein